jgi:tetraacyldisaccharide 4'-kinase
MKTPVFWKDCGLLAHLLRPIAWIYHHVHQHRLRTLPSHKLDKPVICVGNITAGGAGKTPTVIALAQLIQRDMQITPHVLSRGFGGHAHGVVQVDPSLHTAAEVGDEPLLIARHTPCWVARKRLDAAHAALTSGAELLLMDDGLQNPTLTKTCTFLVIDGGFGIGNGYLLPAGPLRETWQSTIKKTDALVLIGHDMHDIATRVPKHIPVFYAQMTPILPTTPAWLDKRLIAFAGIARPQKFYDTLRQMGASVYETVDFGDHYAYTQEDMIRLINRAHAVGAQLITTQKDHVRIPASFAAHVETLPVSLTWHDEPALIAWLKLHL